ncbi:MAG: SBBP repeat-containing protein, partial [Planctomycetota bacterium]|nr:SBBP repeat-containing protein [Planctomycetota bacterium]
MSLGNLLACLKTSYGSHGERVRGRVAVAKAVMGALPRCSAEALESRVLLSDAAPSIELFNASPAVFVENAGQWADQGVRYGFDGAGCAIGFRDAGVDFRLSRGQPETSGAETDPIAGSMASAEAGIQSTAFSLRFEGANRVRPAGEDRAETVFNYFVGEQANWRSNVAGYGAVAYEGLYAGVDLRMAGQRGAMKYEFHVAPGGDYQQIQLRYDGIGGLSVGEDGSLVVDLGEGRGRLVDDTPVIYQEIDGRRVEVAGRFVVVGASSYGFEVTGAWDAGRELVIDPELAWSTYLGGSNDDEGHDIAVDGSGNVLVTGWTYSPGWTSGGFDASYNGDQDAFVAKLSPSGAHLWSTYLGGSNGDGGTGIAVDGSGNVLVTGETWSSGWTSGGFDTSFNGGTSDAFVAKVSPSGGHLWSTYLGGSNWDYGLGIAVDGSGNVLVTGETSSVGWTSGGFDTSYNGGEWGDAFVAKISDGNVNRSPTDLSLSNGSVLENQPVGAAVGMLSTVDPDARDTFTYTLVSGDVGAFTITGDALKTAAAFDYEAKNSYSIRIRSTDQGGLWTEKDFVVSVTNVDIELDLAWSTYLGGGGYDSGQGIAVDGSGNVLVTGYTESSGWTSGGFDTSYNGGEADAFVGKFSPSGEHLWSTYLGDSNWDYGLGIAVDGSGNVLVTGSTESSGWTSGGFDTSYNGDQDAFVGKLSPSGGHLWSTYLGGSNWDYGLGIAVDGSGNVLVTGETSSAGWTSGGFDTSYNGDQDAFVGKLSPSGGHLWSTYLGGSGDDWGHGVAVDGSGNVLVTGETWSSGWTSGGFDTSFNGGTSDAFVAKVSPSGGHLWSTYLGGSNWDYGLGIAVDGSG